MRNGESDRIIGLDVALCRIPLKTPVYLGAVEIARRDYVVIRLRLADGSEGFAFGYDRGLPLFEVVLAAAGAYRKGHARFRNRYRIAALGPTPAPRATMMRAASLLDIAAWDAWCKSVGRPLWQLFGGVRESVPVMPVIGYGMTVEQAAEQTADLAQRGYAFIKVMIDGRDIETDRAIIAATKRELAPGMRFGLDAHWSWSGLDDALPYCRMAEQFGASFVEDPFSYSQIRSVAELAAKVDVPIAVGEDVVDVDTLRALTEAGGILRIDASVSGGIAGAMEGLALARAAHRPVIPHVFAPLHAHFAIANDMIRCIEMISPAIGADPIDDYFTEKHEIENGNWLASPLAGASTGLDWDRLAEFMLRKETLE